VRCEISLARCAEREIDDRPGDKIVGYDGHGLPA